MLISSLIWILHLMNLTIGQDKIMRYRRSSTSSSSTAGKPCPSGCLTCSALNGCLSCKPRLFFHLELDGMKQRGVCLSSCPRGHYDTRLPHISVCKRCKEDCASCSFSESFCTRCHLGRFLFRGKCEHSCPFGLTANSGLRECIECPAGCELCMQRNMCVRCRSDLYTLQGLCYLTCPKGFEPDEQLMQCLPQVHCEVGEWSDWSPCVRKHSMKTFPRGKKTRTRPVLNPPSRFGKPCPKLSHLKKCILKKKKDFYIKCYVIIIMTNAFCLCSKSVYYLTICKYLLLLSWMALSIVI